MPDPAVTKISLRYKGDVCEWGKRPGLCSAGETGIQLVILFY